MQVAFHILNAFEVDGQPVEYWSDVNLFKLMTRDGPAYRTKVMGGRLPEGRSGRAVKYVQRASTSSARSLLIGRPGGPR